MSAARSSLILLALIMGALALQSSVYLNPDSSWLLLLAKQVNAGQRLYIDISETNPPLIVWFNQLVVASGTIVGLKPQHALILWVGGLLAITGRMLIRRPKPFRLASLTAMLCLTLLVGINFGQREHLLMIGLLPYLFYMLRGEKPDDISAIAAGLVCLIKPYFVLIPLALWLVSFASAPQWRRLIDRPHGLMLASAAAYAIYLFLIDDTYLSQVVPLLLQQYDGYNIGMETLYKQLGFYGLFLLPALGGMVFDRAVWVNRAMIGLVAAAVAASLIHYLQSKGWMNHHYPLFVMLMILNGYMLQHGLPHQRLFRQKCIWMGALGSLITLVGCSGYGALTQWRSETTAETKQKIAILKQNERLRVMALSFDLDVAFPAALYADKYWASAYNHLWFLPAIQFAKLRAYPEMNDPVALPLEAKEAVYHRRIVDEFLQQKPDWVIVAKRDNYPHPLHDNGFGFDMIRYYSKDERFKTAWQNYKRVKTIGATQFFSRMNLDASGLSP